MNDSAVKKLFITHFVVTVIIYLVLSAFLSIAISFETKDGKLGGEQLGSSFNQYGPLLVEFMEFRGAGSGEYGGCARNVFIGENRRYLFGFEGFCPRMEEGKIGLLFYTVFLTFGLGAIATPLLLLGIFKRKAHLLHLGMIPVDVIVFLLLWIFFPLPIIHITGPLRGRDLG